MIRRSSFRWFGSLAAAIVLSIVTAHAQDAELAAARDLYAAAAYDDALSLLNRLRASDHPASQSRTIDQYRAFCLLALGRTSDAEQAIEAVIAAEPAYHPAASEASPRVRSAFATVRRRMLPTIIQQTYAQAKGAFDRKEFAAAASGFNLVLTALADEDVAAEAQRPPLVDLRMLAVGFAELSAKAAAPPPLAPSVVSSVAAAVPVPLPRQQPALPRVFTGTEPSVVPPSVMNQVLPAFPGMVTVPRTGAIEVVIDESGAVEAASMVESISLTYDRLALAATKAWRYTPATVDGRPVKFRKVVRISVKRTS